MFSIIAHKEWYLQSAADRNLSELDNLKGLSRLHNPFDKLHLYNLSEWCLWSPINTGTVCVKRRMLFRATMKGKGWRNVYCTDVTRILYFFFKKICFLYVNFWGNVLFHSKACPFTFLLRILTISVLLWKGGVVLQFTKHTVERLCSFIVH